MVKIAYDAHAKDLNLRPFSDFPVKTFMWENSLDFTKDENVWACLIGLSTMYVYRGGADQMIVQRFLASRNLKEAQSTISSLINSQAAVIYVDVVARFFNLDEKHSATVTKGIALVVGGVMTAYAIAAPHLGSAAKIIMVFYNSATGPFLGLFFMALVFPWANGIMCQQTSSFLENTACHVAQEEPSTAV
ncbi:hypothetical protein V5799_030189 [Amblyomma americanum]|uniref:Uncharacterized protein n=1 Tax=Amblyomma americanum TaxID=6943 RepID=A0AAQ4ENV6_AMBAM